MPLIDLWQGNQSVVQKMTIEQIVTTAGDGRARDGSACQEELRIFLSKVPSTDLSRYAGQCLDAPFNKSGYVLQDIVNELGRRLDYEVENGRYQGVKGAIGFDGLWRPVDGPAILVEVKTTDAYRLSLDTIVNYRNRLRSDGSIPEDSSVLIVVGRTDTGELEAQVRGSRYAWDIRLVSVEWLTKLVEIKESADSEATMQKIRRILTPIEYTRIDDLIDVIFTTALDVEAATAVETGEAEPVAEELSKPESSIQLTPPKLLQAKRDSIVAALSARLDCDLIRKSRAKFADSAKKIRAVCTISKRYENGMALYWYAYHPAWNEYLSEVEKGFLVLGCMDLDQAFVLPQEMVAEHLDELYTTTRKDGAEKYWHIQIFASDNQGFDLRLPYTNSGISLGQYAMPLAA